MLGAIILFVQLEICVKRYNNGTFVFIVWEVLVTVILLLLSLPV